MKENVRFMKCAHCGNMVGFIEDKGVPIICCGQPMDEMVANSTDASTEKHVPVATVDGKCVTVKIGSVTHPMEDAHYIEWIAVVSEKSTERISLKPGEAPEAVFTYKGPSTAYAYCNLHGLWKVDIK